MSKFGLLASLLASAAAQCLPGNATCLPSWKPTWDMMRSTVLYTCNNTGMHEVSHALKYGTVVYDWSNAKQLWANAHPMNSEELITKQAEAVLAADPGIAGEGPRVWAYRNTIKALNWYSSVREKLDDPKYASWFIKFKDYKGPESNTSYHVPCCDWYGNATHPPKCSGFYHDQEQTPEHRGGGRPYPVDGECVEQCDCGPINPCGEYIFDHRGGEVEGRTFREWFINEYMVTGETLLHKNPKTGALQPIGLGWLDDAMTPTGPTEEDRNYITDTGASAAEMAEQVAAYRASMEALIAKVLPMGGYWWQLMDAQNGKVAGTDKTSAECAAALRAFCVAAPPSWHRLTMNNIPRGGKAPDSNEPIGEAALLDYTAEFLLTRGPYAMLGYSWYGCTGSADAGGGASPDPPRPKTAWDADYGTPAAPCAESSATPGVFTREWSKATVTWDCHAGHGTIDMKEDLVEAQK